jgi:hypothetical protein
MSIFRWSNTDLKTINHHTPSNIIIIVLVVVLYFYVCLFGFSFTFLIVFVLVVMDSCWCCVAFMVVNLFRGECYFAWRQTQLISETSCGTVCSDNVNSSCVHKTPCLAQPIVVVISNPFDINLIFTPPSEPRCKYIGWFHPFRFLCCYFVLVFHRSVVFYMSCPSWFCQFHVVWWWNQLKFPACNFYSSPRTQGNVKRSHYSSGQALRVPEVWGSQI